MEEIWKPIKGFEGYYEVSNIGNIRSVDRLIEKPKHKTQKSCIMKGKDVKQFTLYGYRICNLYKNSKYKNIRVHRVVAEAFCNDYFDGCEVHHIDENRSNNCYKNLKCSSKLEHLETHGNGRKKIVKISKTGEKTYYSGIRDAAKINDVSHQAIVAVLKGRKPSCVGCRWEYV